MGTHEEARKKRKAIADWMRETGATVTEAASHFGIGYEQARRAATENGLVIGRERQHLRDAGIVDFLDKGHSYEEAAKKFKLTHYQIDMAAKRLGFKKAENKTLTTVWLSIIAALQNTDDTYRVVARQHNVSKSTVAHIAAKARQAGIAIPSRAVRQKKAQENDGNEASENSDQTAQEMAESPTSETT